MERDQIIREIRRTANANGGVPLGRLRFENETGIRYHEWYGQHWTRWSDAVREAGFEPNRMSEAYDNDFLVEQLALLTRRLQRVPTLGDLMLAKKSDSLRLVSCRGALSGCVPNSTGQVDSPRAAF